MKVKGVTVLCDDTQGSVSRQAPGYPAVAELELAENPEDISFRKKEILMWHDLSLHLAIDQGCMTFCSARSVSGNLCTPQDCPGLAPGADSAGSLNPGSARPTVFIATG